MSFNPLSIGSSVPPQPDHSTLPSKSAPLPGSKDPVATVPPDQISLSGTHEPQFQRLQSGNDRRNAAAAGIRSTDRSLAQLGQKIDGLKAPLQAIVKNFPPFSPEDKARVKLLMSYSSLRKEIDQLTVPAPPEVVRARRAQALPAPLHSDASDSQIADHVADLDAAGAALEGMRAGLAADTAALVHDGRFSRIFSGPNATESGTFPAPLTESAAALKSAQVGQQFAAVVSQGVATGGSQFLKGLG